SMIKVSGVAMKPLKVNYLNLSSSLLIQYRALLVKNFSLAETVGNRIGFVILDKLLEELK
ncbi:13751_t:CDS:2, partial [Gigaspora margarita]